MCRTLYTQAVDCIKSPFLNLIRFVIVEKNSPFSVMLNRVYCRLQGSNIWSTDPESVEVDVRERQILVLVFFHAVKNLGAQLAE